MLILPRICNCRLHLTISSLSCSRFSGASKYVSIPSAFLKTFSGRSHGLVGIMHLDTKTMLLSSTEGYLQYLKLRWRMSEHVKRPKTDFLLTVFYATPNSFLTQLLYVFPLVCEASSSTLAATSCKQLLSAKHAPSISKTTVVNILLNVISLLKCDNGARDVASTEMQTARMER